MDYQKQVKEIVNKALTEYEQAIEYEIEDIEKAEGNVYFLCSNGDLKYIGQREAKGIKERLKNHLLGSGFKTDENNKQTGTGSKWDKVENELNQGKKMTFKTILIKPDSLRTTVELELIKYFSPEWNEHGK